jgi:hypothetical protein
MKHIIEDVLGGCRKHVANTKQSDHLLTACYSCRMPTSRCSHIEWDCSAVHEQCKDEGESVPTHCDMVNKTNMHKQHVYLTGCVRITCTHSLVVAPFNQK